MATHPLMPHAVQGRYRVGLALTMLLSLASGCMCQKGIQLQGDWSLQLNHVPWNHEGAGCLADEPLPHAVAAPLAAPPAPVHRFHPVPTAAPTIPPPLAASRRAQPAVDPPETSPEPLMASKDPSLAAPHDPAMPRPLPENSEAVSVLTLKPAASSHASSWVFRPEANSPRQNTSADRRHLGDAWRSPSTRR